MKTKLQSILSIFAKIAFVLAIICSTAYLLMLGYNNNLLLDDYGFVAEVDRGGAYGLMKSAYFGLQSRFSAFYILGWILKIWGHASNLIGYTILLLVLGYGTLYYALRNITQLTNKWLLFGSAILITNVSIMAYFEMSTFYWVCCAVYTLSTYAAIALFTAIFFSNGKLWARWLIVVFCSLYISGGAENFTPIVIATLGLVLLYKMISNRTWLWTTPQLQMIVVGLLILCVGFLAVLLAPGTHNREASMSGFAGQFSFLPYFAKLASALAVFTMRLVSRSLYYFLLLPIGFVIGQRIEFSTQCSTWKLVFISLGVVFCIIFLSVAASVYGMGWYSPLRSYSFVSFLISAFVIYWGTLAGVRTKPIVADSMAVISLSIISAISIYFYQWEHPMVADYHAQIVARNSYIEEQVNAGRTEVLVIEPVTHSQILNTYALMRTAINKCLGKQSPKISEPATYFPYEQYELSIDPADWKNVDMQRYFNVHFDIISKETPN